MRSPPGAVWWAVAVASCARLTVILKFPCPDVSADPRSPQLERPYELQRTGLRGDRAGDATESAGWQRTLPSAAVPGSSSPSRRRVSCCLTPIALRSRFGIGDRHILLSRPSRNQTRSTVGHTGYFWMICRSTSARIFPQRGCKLNEPNGFKPLRRVEDRIIPASLPPKFCSQPVKSLFVRD